MVGGWVLEARAQKRHGATRARNCAAWIEWERQTRAGLTLDRRRTAHRTRGLNHKKPAGRPFIRWRFSKIKNAASVLRHSRLRREPRGKRVAQRHQNRGESLKLQRLCRLPRRIRRQVVMMPVVLRRITVMVIIVTMFRGPRLRRATIRRPAVRREDVPGGKKPAEESQQSKDSMKGAHRRCLSAKEQPFVKPHARPRLSRSETTVDLRGQALSR